MTTARILPLEWCHWCHARIVDRWLHWCGALFCSRRCMKAWDADLGGYAHDDGPQGEPDNATT